MRNGIMSKPTKVKCQLVGVGSCHVVVLQSPLTTMQSRASFAKIHLSQQIGVFSDESKTWLTLRLVVKQNHWNPNLRGIS